jgi:hypothetical protein
MPHFPSMGGRAYAAFSGGPYYCYRTRDRRALSMPAIPMASGHVFATVLLAFLMLFAGNISYEI